MNLQKLFEDGPAYRSMGMFPVVLACDEDIDLADDSYEAQALFVYSVPQVGDQVFFSNGRSAKVKAIRHKVIDMDGMGSPSAIIFVVAAYN